MMAWLSFSVVCGPKFIVPRHRRLTLRPVRPSDVYSMVFLLGSYRVRACTHRGSHVPRLARRAVIDDGCSPRRQVAEERPINHRLMATAWHVEHAPYFFSAKISAKKSFMACHDRRSAWAS